MDYNITLEIEFNGVGRHMARQVAQELETKAKSIEDTFFVASDGDCAIVSISPPLDELPPAQIFYDSREG